MQIMKRLITYFTTASYYFLLPRSKYSLQHSTFSQCCSLNARGQASHPYRTECKITVFYISFLLDAIREVEILK